MKYNQLLELNEKELLELYKSTSAIGLKTIIFYLLYNELDPLSLELNLKNPEDYLNEIEPFVSPKNFKTLIPCTIENLLCMLHLNFANGDYNEYLISELFNTPSIKTYSHEDKLNVVQTLILKNKLKTSANFLYAKIQDNLLLTKMNDKKLQYSFGLKCLDDQLINKLGSEFSNFLELGWVNNNGDKEEFRAALSDFLKTLSNQNVIALIREDNIRALNLTKEYNFKEIKRIESPYSSNILVVLQPSI